jgi:hypothetical protein
VITCVRYVPISIRSCPCCAVAPSAPWAADLSGVDRALGCRYDALMVARSVEVQAEGGHAAAQPTLRPCRVVTVWRTLAWLATLALGCSPQVVASTVDGGLANSSVGGDASGGVMDASGPVLADAFPWPCPTKGCTNGVPCADDGCCVNAKCLAQGENCAANLGACEQKSCGGCGALNQPCCVGQDLPGGTCAVDAVYLSAWYDGPACSDPDTVCSDTGTCLACGAEGQLCCLDKDCAPNFECVQGVCAPCGGIGQLCCEAYSCSDGGRCLDYPGQDECVAPDPCDGAVCAGCGGTGQACCPGGPGDAGGGCFESVCVDGVCVQEHP